MYISESKNVQHGPSLYVYFVPIKTTARNIYFSAGDGMYLLCVFSQNVHNEPVVLS